MGFLRKLMGRAPRPEVILTEAIEHLQIGILTNLILQYRSRPDPNEAVLLANCVLSHAILTTPTDLEAQEFQKKHSSLVSEQALMLAQNAEIHDALSHLYAAITLYLVIRTGSPVSEESNQLCARATELSIYLPNTFDICGSDDAIQCVNAIAKFADGYMQRALGRQPG